jgi:hypothetical protein
MYIIFATKLFFTKDTFQKRDHFMKNASRFSALAAVLLAGAVSACTTIRELPPDPADAEMSVEQTEEREYSRKLLEAFLRDKLHLTMHRDKRYLQPVSHGVLFVGTFIKPGREYLSNRTVGKMSERCEGYGKRLDTDDFDICDLMHMEQVINSYLGFCMRRKTLSFRRLYIDKMGSLFWKYFYVRGCYRSVRVKSKYRLLN